jgi:hypothetical protein
MVQEVDHAKLRERGIDLNRGGQSWLVQRQHTQAKL